MSEDKSSKDLAGSVTLYDPLVEQPKTRQQRIVAAVSRTVAAVLAHVVAGGLLVTLAPHCNVEPPPPAEKSVIEVAVSVVQEQVEIEEVIVEEPELEVEEPQPEVEPEPEPVPEPDPEPEPVVKPEPRPEPVPEPPRPDSQPDPEPENKPAGEAESMNPVHLEGLTMESTVESGDGPAIKVGEGIQSGKVSTRYVDPNRFGKIQTGDGDGDGYGRGSSPGAGAATAKSCPPKKARILFQPKGEYPLQAQRRRLEGTVTGLVDVNVRGEVTRVRIVKKAGNGFDEAAEAAFRQIRYAPAEQNCQPVASTERVTNTFVLED